ncbi:MAG TPA: hypothetical protein VIV61_06910 [Candidatus Ozemobacteraceae bacterium]
MKNDVKTYPKWQEVRKRYFAKEELENIDEEVQAEIEQIRRLQDCVSREAANYMAKEGIGFNEFMRRLAASPRKVTKILKGDCNLTMASIAQLAALLGKRVKLVFE